MSVLFRIWPYLAAIVAVLFSFYLAYSHGYSVAKNHYELTISKMEKSALEQELKAKAKAAKVRSEADKKAVEKIAKTEKTLSTQLGGLKDALELTRNDCLRARFDEPISIWLRNLEQQRHP
ncbi:MAG: hypothetical protein SVC26_09430 [Pseudomonadota bacterium]|nr:hypothetical protein [Pseudomonadota bacterium]